MSGLHYTKSGALDMRYSSSKAAASSSSYSSRPSYNSSAGSSPAYSSYSSSSTPSSGGLHYKKDGSLDMRYSSSKAASCYSGSTGRSSYWSTPNSSAAVASGSSSSYNTPSTGDLHYKKDGSLDMRYSSSKQAAGYMEAALPSGHMHYKKDGSFDMRYNSSKVAASISSQLQKMQLSPSDQHARKQGIPEHVPIKSDGTPDMRKSTAKEWVASQGAACHGANIPSWVPKHKDGSINMNSAVGRAFAGSLRITPPANMRNKYWVERQMSENFLQQLSAERDENIPLPCRPAMLTEPIPREYTRKQTSYDDSTGAYGVGRSLPANTDQIEYSSLIFADGDEKKAVLGQGSFGVVLKAMLNGKKVAVKKLHLDQLTKKEKDSFCKELHILAHLGKHQNLVKLYGYCLKPLCIVMELVELGSLSRLLHYCDDPVVEAKMTDGRVKRNIIFGVANGMLQLHFSSIVHGDLKPQNVLVSDNYEAKITDFGLATLRGKSSSTVASKKLVDDDEETGMAGGTAGYMAPELLDSTSPPDFSSDVYSFGVLVNELIAEEEPYSDQYANFAGRGPFGAANYAKQGKRPTISSSTPTAVKQLITSCWSPTPSSRPKFDAIVSIIEQETFMIPNSF